MIHIRTRGVFGWVANISRRYRAPEKPEVRTWGGIPVVCTNCLVPSTHHDFRRALVIVVFIVEQGERCLAIPYRYYLIQTFGGGMEISGIVGRA